MQFQTSTLHSGFAALMIIAAAAIAQVGTSTVTGRVVDASGAIVPGVNVMVVNLDTNFQFRAVTNEEGLFRVQSLQPGPYRVTFEAAGFKRLVRENVELRTGDVLPVNASLEVGATTESIEVSASAQLLETQTSATGTVTAGKFLYTLPTFQRFANSTLNYVPGMTAEGYTWGETLGGFHVAGARGAPSFFDDGMNAQVPSAETATMKVPLNSVAEIQVLTTALPAEHGHSAAGVISVVTKTGTNTLHGAVTMFGRTRDMQHRRFFDMYRMSQPMPGYPQGRSAFVMHPDLSLSGPIWIPKVYNGKNKTFFFFSYQKYIEKMKATQYYGTVPTAEMKNGDFSFGGIGQPIYDPGSTRRLADGTWARDPIPGSMIPQSRIDPVARKVLALDPWNTPNNPSALTTTGPYNNYYWVEYARSFKPDWSLRLDHQFTQNFKLNGSVTYSSNAGLGRPQMWHLPEFDGSNYSNNPWSSYNWTVGNTWVISSSTINDIKLGYFRRRNWTWSSSYVVDGGEHLGIPNLPEKAMPQLRTGYGFNTAGPANNVNETISLREDLTKIRGTHAFKMGYELLRFRQNQWSIPSNVAGSFGFDSAAGLQPTGIAMPRTGNTFAGFLLGYVNQATFARNLASWLPRASIHSFYFQDDWKVSPELTLNLGLRYSNESPFMTKWSQMSQWDPNFMDPVAGKMGGVTHPTSPLNERDNNNFQPRFGVAWHPLKKWVFRGGFAVNTIDVKFPGGQFEEYSVSANQQAQPGDPRPIYAISRGPDPVLMLVRPDGTSPYQGTNYGARSSARYTPDMHNPYQLNWNTSIQYELMPNYLLELAYQGSAGVGLLENWPLNTLPLDYAKGDRTLNMQLAVAGQNYRPYNHFGDVGLRNANMGHSTYHSGTIKLEKRYSQGINFITFYTFSKTIDSAGGGVAPIGNRSLNKARASYDRTQRFVGSVTYELPVGKGKKWLNRGGITNLLLGGYQVVWIQTFETGNPLTFGFTNSPYNYLPTWMGDRRPNLNGEVRLRDDWRDFGGDRFNASNMNSVWTGIDVFSYPAEFSAGNAGRNIASGQGLRWTQVSAQKFIPITERVHVEIRWEMNNALHTYNFTNPTTTVDLVNRRTFGKISSDSSSSSMGGAPIMHMTFRMTF